MPWKFAMDADSSRTQAEQLTERRTRLALEDEARAQERQSNLAELCSEANAPGERVSAWEKLHKLRMPADPQHAILRVIAASTQLALADVQAVQAARKR